MKQYTVYFSDKQGMLTVKAAYFEITQTGKFIILYDEKRTPIAIFPEEHVNGIVQQ